MAEQLDDKEIQEILKTGTDLRQYSRQIEKEFKEVENKSIEDYIKESQNIANLHVGSFLSNSFLPLKKGKSDDTNI